MLSSSNVTTISKQFGVSMETFRRQFANSEPNTNIYNSEAFYQYTELVFKNNQL